MSHTAEISFFMASSHLIARHARETAGRLAPAAHFAKFESRHVDRPAPCIGDLQDIVRTMQVRHQPEGDAGGGGSGIRTHDTVSRIHAFQASAFSHSAIPPQRRARQHAGGAL
jgi:hypothetical protein